MRQSIKVGAKIRDYQLLMPESLVFSHAKILFYFLNAIPIFIFLVGDINGTEGYIKHGKSYLTIYNFNLFSKILEGQPKLAVCLLCLHMIHVHSIGCFCHSWSSVVMII